MFWRIAHRFVIWFPPAAGGAYASILLIAAESAPSNSNAKAFLNAQISLLSDTVSASLFPLYLALIIAVWLAAFLWTGHKSERVSSGVLPAHQPRQTPNFTRVQRRRGGDDVTGETATPALIEKFTPAITPQLAAEPEKVGTDQDQVNAAIATRYAAMEVRHEVLVSTRETITRALEDAEAEWPKVVPLLSGRTPEPKIIGYLRSSWAMPVRLVEMKYDDLLSKTAPDGAIDLRGSMPDVALRVDEHDSQEQMRDEERRLWYRRLYYKRAEALQRANQAVTEIDTELRDIERRLALASGKNLNGTK